MNSRGASGVVFITSALVLVIEIVAGRLMAPYVGVSLEAFTAIIGTVLAGIAAGSAIGGRLADQRDPRILIGPALLGSGVLTWLSIPIVATLGPGSNGTPPEIIILTACAFLIPTALLSSISPMVAKLRLGSLEETGSVVGSLSAAGTFGALVGTFGTGFILLTLLPIRVIMISIGALLVVGGLVATGWLNRKRPGGLEVGALVVAGLLTMAVGTDCDYETDYACARVVPDQDRPGGRSLILDQVRHAHVDVDDPTHLEVRYAKVLGSVVDAMTPGPIEVLHVGGGGFSLPRYVSATRPGSVNTVLEIDEGLVAIAEAELDLASVENLELHIGDARLELPDLETDRYDIIIGDAFGGDVVPWHLTTDEAAAHYDRLLTDDGIYVMNLIDGNTNRFGRAQMKTLALHFEHVGVVVPVEQDEPDRRRNLIIVASDMPFPDFELEPGTGQPLFGQEAEDFIGDAIVLTDDFAPAEQIKH